jgi:Tol biopolymer transport system component/predicted Ser/Thr protein kinase
MPLTPGTRLGPYEIVSPLGAGGMGEVYRANDTNLGRQVALKVLPPAFAKDAERMARFKREAQVLASLNHPNIAAIYGIEGSAIVMELVEGKDLAGPLPLDETLPIAKQIAEALEAAHEKGIVHRDLKPANVKITPQGVVKLLDFGLAKAIEPVEPVDMSNSPTLSLAMTSAGIILGTAAYMSPEQARGKTVDRRADIWAFGVVLLETLTGKKTYPGETIADTLAAVITKDPDLGGLPDGTPPVLRRLLQRCLEKDPRRRLQWIGEARVAIEEYLASPKSGAEAPRRAEAHPTLPWVLAAVLGVVGLGLGFGYYRASRPAPLPPAMHLNVDLGDEAPLVPGGRVTNGAFAISPDGASLALCLVGKDGKSYLHTRSLGSDQMTLLAGTEGASDPFFSPDGKWIGFTAKHKLQKISVASGTPTILCDAPMMRGAVWGQDGQIIAALSASTGLSRIPADGGTPSPLTTLNAPELTHRYPDLLPGGGVLLFSASDTLGQAIRDSAIEVMSLKTGQRKTLLRQGFSPHYIARNGTGYLIYQQGSTLYASPFDREKLELTGLAVPVLSGVSASGFLLGHFSVSAAGTMVYLPGNELRSKGYPISMWDSTGKSKPVLAESGFYQGSRLSPDGKRLAFSRDSGNGSDIWVKEIDRGAPSRISFLPLMNSWPVWTPDGKYIVFQSVNHPAAGLYWARSDGSGEVARLTGDGTMRTPYSFSPDGKRLAYSLFTKGNSDIFTSVLDGDPSHPTLGKPELFLGTPFEESNPAFSPDGRWLAYQSTESGAYGIYVRPFPGPGGKWRISTDVGSQPRWARDGHEIFFFGSNRIMAVHYSVKGDEFVPEKPRVWSDEGVLFAPNSFSYDVSPDGRYAVGNLLRGEE